MFSVRSMVTAVKDHAEEESRRVGEMRKKAVDDMDLRGEYRRAHGLEKTGGKGGFGGWGVKKSGRELEVMDNLVPVAEGPGSRSGDWVEDKIREAEVEAAKLAEEEVKEAAKEETVPAPVPEPEKKKSSWW